MTVTTPTEPVRVLRVDSSARGDQSTTRALSDKLMAKLERDHGALDVSTRDVSEGLPVVNPDWVGANFTDEADRTAAQRAALALSDELIAELKAADIVVIGAPIYNFGIPAALKAWIDQIARARVTFRYTETGPVGLLDGKRAFVVSASGGTGIGSEIDFATPYMKHVLGFIGIHDVTVIGADRQMVDAEAGDKAEAAIEAVAA
jgi:FMN-dependent NADH-azoreductase